MALTMSLSEAAKLIGFGPQKLTVLADAGMVTYVDCSVPGSVKKVRRFTEKAIHEFIERQTREPRKPRQRRKPIKFKVRYV